MIVNTILNSYSRFKWNKLLTHLMLCAYTYQKHSKFLLFYEKSNKIENITTLNLYEIIKLLTDNDIKCTVSMNYSKDDFISYNLEITFPDYKTKNTELLNIYFDSEKRYLDKIKNINNLISTNNNSTTIEVNKSTDNVIRWKEYMKNKYNSKTEHEYIEKMIVPEILITNKSLFKYMIGKVDQETGNFSYVDGASLGLINIVKFLANYTLPYIFRIEKNNLFLEINLLHNLRTENYTVKLDKLKNFINTISSQYSEYENFIKELQKIECDEYINEINFIDIKYQKLIDELNFNIQNLTNNYKENEGADISINSTFEVIDYNFKTIISNICNKLNLKFTEEKRNNYMWSDDVLNIKGWYIN